jgi:hypothetical protein
LAPSALNALAALFRRLGIDWVLIGALAANRYRIAPRLTADVDLLLATARPDLENLGWIQFWEVDDLWQRLVASRREVER